MLIIIIIIIILLIYYYLTTPINLKTDISYGHNTKIPKIIVTTYSENMMNDLYQKNWEEMASMNPDFVIHKYNNHDTRLFLSQYFPDDVVQTYDTLTPGAYKADFFRYCYLYIHGGVYIDYNKTFTIPLDEIIPTDADFVASLDGVPNYLFTAFIAIRPKHDLMMRCIRGCVENTNNRYYGKDALCPTGPGLFGKMYIQKYNLDKINIGRVDLQGDIIYIYQHKNLNHAVYNLNRRKIIKTTPSSIRSRIEKNRNDTKNRYDKLWDLKKIYSSSN